MNYFNRLRSWFRQTETESSRDMPPGVWSIGIYQGPSPFELRPAPQAINPVLQATDVTDAPTEFVADPFMVQENGTWHMFFEIFNAETRLGNIACAVSQDGFSWKYQQRVLVEPFSLSYPYIFKHDRRYYLIPECNATRTIRLYRAVTFPYHWRFERTLLKRQRFSDATVLFYQNRWWIFVATRSRPMNNGKLRLYSAPQLEGPWKEHPKSPIVRYNPHYARPAGRILILDDCLVRFAQDDFPEYGKQVWAFCITKLTPTDYQEHGPYPEKPVLTGSGSGWNELSMHTLDAHRLPDGGWLACVDGYGAPR